MGICFFSFYHCEKWNALGWFGMVLHRAKICWALIACLSQDRGTGLFPSSTRVHCCTEKQNVCVPCGIAGCLELPHKYSYIVFRNYRKKIKTERLAFKNVFPLKKRATVLDLCRFPLKADKRHIFNFYSERV